MSDQVTVGEYSLEISGDEVLVRDESGAIVETVDLDDASGKVTLPDGQKIDLAAVLAEKGLDRFDTAAGAANDNAGADDSGSGSFRALTGGEDQVGRRGSSGILGGTAQGYGLFEGEPEIQSARPELLQTRASFDWSRHEQSNKPSDHSGNENQSNGDPLDDDEDDEGVTSPSDNLPPSGNSNVPQPTDNHQQPQDVEPDEEPTPPPTDEQEQPEEDEQEPSTPPTDEQEQPEDEQGEEPSAPPTDEQEQPEDEPEEEPSTPPTDEQEQPEDEQEEEPSTPPTDEQQQLEDGEQDEQPQPQAVNAAPTDINLAGATVVENTSGAVVGALTVVDPDDGDTHSFAVSDDRFEVVSGQLKLKDGVSLDFEATSSLDVVVTATDKAGNQVSETFSITVGDANESQTSLALGNDHVSENAAGAVVGTIFVADPDAGDIQSFQVSDSRFEVVDNALTLKDGVSLDFESESSVAVTITATDAGGHVIEKDFTINVDNANEAPVVAAAGGSFDTKNASYQPMVDFSDIDSDTLSQAVIHTNGFQSGDTLNIPGSSSFNVTIDHTGADYTVTIVGKTGTETVDQYEAFANSISFSSNSQVAGERHIEYSVTDSGGATSNVSSADITVTSSYELYTSQLGKGQTTAGAGDDTLYIDTKSFSPVEMGDGYDTVHLAQNKRSFGHDDAIKLEDVEAIDTTGYGANTVSLSIHDVLNMTDGDHHLTITGDKGDIVNLTGSGNPNWTMVGSNGEFTTYTWNDASHQAIVEISNQLTTQVS